MNLIKYNKAKRYAEKVTHGYDHNDIVHDAFIKWYDKTQANLFDQELPTIFKVVKYTILSRWEKSYSYMENGDKKVRLMNSISPDSPHHSTFFIYSNPQSEQNANSLREVSASVMKGDHLTVFDMLVEGHRLVDIAEKMEVTPQYVGWLVKNIRETVSKLL